MAALLSDACAVASDGAWPALAASEEAASVDSCGAVSEVRAVAPAARTRRPGRLPCCWPRPQRGQAYAGSCRSPPWGAGQPPESRRDEAWAAYITAKTAAEDDLAVRDLDWTIVRPGSLTDAAPTGRVRLAVPPVPRGTIPRADVAAVITALLDEPGTRHQTLELVSGDAPIAAAVHSIS